MSKRKEIRVGFIGAGGICRVRHLPNLAKMDGVHVVAVSNRSVESGRKVAGEFGIPEVLEDWREVVERKDIDAVFIGTWPYMHREMSCAALKAGKHVFCQARMACDLGEAKQMVKAAKAQPGLVAMLCPPPHRMPFEPYVKRVIESGQLGKLTLVELRSVSGANLDVNSVTWREQVQYSGKQALAMGIYAETLNAWVGEYETLAAEVSTPVGVKDDGLGQEVKIEIPQLVVITGRLKSGVIINEQHTGLAADKSTRGDSITIYGLDGTLRYEFMSDRLMMAEAGGELKKVEVPKSMQNPWRAEEEFIEAVGKAMQHEKWKVSPDFEEGLAYMRKVEAVHVAAASGMAVEVGKL